MPAPSTSTGWDLTALAFIAGFAIATLIFWPLLQRAHERKRPHEQKRTDEQRKAPEPNGAQARTTASATRAGKHALGKPAPRRAEPSKVAHAVPQQSASPENQTAVSEPHATASSAAESSAGEAPAQDLFEQLHGPKFDHFRTRIAHLRAQLNEH